jgi:hypothetical protein
MLGLAHRRVIAALVCLVAFLSWLDPQISPPPLQQYSLAQSTKKSEQKSSGAPTEDLIFGYPAIDVFTGILAFATLILAWMTIRQVKDTRAIQRAHIFPLQPQSAWLKAEENGSVHGLRLWVPWKNSGATPAPSVNSLIGITWVQNPDNFQFGEAGHQGRYQPFVLGPGAEIPSGTVDITLSPFNDLVIHQTGAQFFWGWARYKDIFDENTIHVVEFCFRVTAEGKLGLEKTPLPRIGFAFDGPHNRYYDEPA